MFTSSGFFRNSPCPFLAEGACDRSHCHFKHERPVQTASTNHLSGSDVAQEDHSDDNHSSDTVLRLDIVKDAVAKVRNAMEKEQRDLGHHHGNYMPYDPSLGETSPRGAVPAPAVHSKLPSTMPGVTGRLEYRPTPIAELKKRCAAGVDVEYDPTCPSTAIGGSLGYQPTPITDLESKLDTSEVRQEPTVNKYSEAFKYQGTDMEYDPIMNYSALPKQQKRKLSEFSEQSSAQPVSKQRKVGQDHHALDSTQDNSKLKQDVTADNLSNTEEIEPRTSESHTASESSLSNSKLRESDSDTESQTGLGLSKTPHRTMNNKDIDKNTKQLLESKSSTRKTGASGLLNKLGNNTNVSSGQDRGDIKKRKSSKHLKDANIRKDQSETSDEKAAKHGNDFSGTSKTKSKQKDAKSTVNKKNSTRKNPAKEVKTTERECRQHSKVKTLKTENSSASKSRSKLKNPDKNSSSDNLPKETEGDNSVIDLVSEDYSTDMSDREKKRKLKKARHEETRHQTPEDVVYVSSTSDECNTHKNLIKTKKQKLNPSDSDEYLSKLNSTKVKTTKVYPGSKSTENKLNKHVGHKQGGKDSKHLKTSSEGSKSSHEHEKEKGGKRKGKSSTSCSSNSVSKKGVSNDKQAKLTAHKSPQKKSPYNLTFPDFNSDTCAREKSARSKAALKKLKSREDGQSKVTPGIKVSHADLFGDDSEEDVSMATGDGTSQDASSDDSIGGPDLDPDVLRRLEEEEFEDTEDPYEECLRIFQETQGKMADNKMGSQDHSQESLTEEELHFTSLPGQAGKKRTAHLASFDTSNMRRLTQKRPRPSASQQIHDRYKRLQEAAAAAPPAEPKISHKDMHADHGKA